MSGVAIVLLLLAPDPSASAPHPTSARIPAMPPHGSSVDVAGELEIPSSFGLSAEQAARLGETGFCIVLDPKIHGQAVREMFELATDEYPFVTSDLAAHTFMIVMRATLDELERLVLLPMVSRFSRDLIAAAADQCLHAPEETRNAAESNAAWFAVPALLLGNAAEDRVLSPRMRQRVAQEVSMIREARETATSPVRGVRDDYARYRPRGRFSNRAELTGYFQAMRWYGCSMFRCQSAEETRQATLLVGLLSRRPDLLAAWEEIDRILGLFFGPRDDLAIPDYEEALRSVVGGVSGNGPSAVGPRKRASDDLAMLAGDSLALRLVREDLLRRPPPRINTGLVDRGSDWRREAAGLRIFGQRYTRMAHILQLEMEETPEPGPALASKAIVAALGIEEYGVAPGARMCAPPPPADRLGDLTEGVLYCLEGLFPIEPDAPELFSDPAWNLKSLNTALGAWTEVCHVTALYDKDATYAKATTIMTDRFRGYVEPAPRFFSRLDALLMRIGDALEECGYFEALDGERVRLEADRDSAGRPGWDPVHLTVTAPRPSARGEWRSRLELPDRKRYADLSAVLRRCEAIARRETRGEEQDAADGVFLMTIGRRLRQISFHLDSVPGELRSMAVVCDPATEFLSGECLQVGVGAPAALFVAVPHGRRRIVCRGPVYSFYEFMRPAAGRLDDVEWRRILDEPAGRRPVSWTAERRELSCFSGQRR